MRSSEYIALEGRMAAAVLLCLLLLNAASIMAQPSAEQSNSPASLAKTKSMAEAQHEIVVLLIQKKEYEKAMTEANKIFDMKWPDDQEPLLIKEIRNLSDQFLRSGQSSMALKLVERNLSRFRKPASQAALWKEMGYLHKSMNQIDRSIDCFKKARDLEGGQ